jgi:tetratricopeptide (TPR) repeat protein
MIEFGRELWRLFGGHARAEGLTGGDHALLELLDLELLLDEGRTADFTAGRALLRDKGQARLVAAGVWREAARRSGDPAHLRKAAALAETAAESFDAARRIDPWAAARVEQARCALLGAELFGDDGLNAAAETAFRDARAAARSGATAALADIGVAIVEARQGVNLGDAAAALAAHRAFDAPIAALDAMVRRYPVARVQAAEARLARAELTSAWGARIKDACLLQMAVDDAAETVRRVDPAYEPLTWARAEIVRGQSLALKGEALGELEPIATGASALAAGLEDLNRDHSPLDWARAHLALGQALEALGEAASDARIFERAITCFDRAEQVLKAQTGLPLRGVAAIERALCLARSAELTGDVAVLDAAEAAMKIELSRQSPRRDPVGWALAQLHLARIYEARMDLTARDRGERVAAFTALDAALDVFAEHGQRSLSIAAAEAMARLRARAQAS